MQDMSSVEVDRLLICPLEGTGLDNTHPSFELPGVCNLMVRAGERECTSCTFFLLQSYKCSEHLGTVVSVNMRWFTYGFMSRG